MATPVEQLKNWFDSLPSKLLKKGFSQPASLTVISPGGRELKESSHLFRRVLTTFIC